ncbi:MAG: phosphoglucosamine mutase [Clostridia bacterium]|nr:phosphoglucosamine mutase [Clostridia bacterium]
MGKYFGTDGFRGEANVTLTVEHAYKIGRFLGAYYNKKGTKSKIVIGKDTRLSSYMLEYALAAGICASGADAYLLHVTTTPSVAFVAKSEDFDAGIMISASHNPYTDNGIKLINSDGEKMSDGLTDKIEEYLDGKGEIPLAKGENIGRTVDYAQGRNRYTGYVIGCARHSYKNIKIGIDSANGSTWMLAKSIFDALGAKTFVIGNTPNGTNINRDCGSTHIEALSRLVKDNSLDIGFAFDGDADRCLAVDECGNVINGEDILFFAAKYMKSHGDLHNGTVVTTVMSNLGLVKSLENEGIKCILTDVGDRFVWEKMREGGYSLGGEESGHIIFSKYSTTGDGLITAIKIMEILIESKGKASALAKDLIRYPHLTKSIRVPDKDAAINAPSVVKARSECEKTLHGEGRILLRKSGTEPVVRIMVEHPSESTCREIVDSLSTAILSATS